MMGKSVRKLMSNIQNTYIIPPMIQRLKGIIMTKKIAPRGGRNGKE